jgi:hypothetical protein
MSPVLRCAALALLLCGTCRAEPIIWLDDNVDLKGKRTLFVPSVRNQTGKTFEPDPARLVSDALHERLRKGGMTLISRSESGREFITVESGLMDYEAGSALQRWALPGMGATLCVVRSVLRDGASGTVLGEIIASGAVAGGGLFSLGAETTIPSSVGAEIAQAIISLVDKRAEER